MKPFAVHRLFFRLLPQKFRQAAARLDAVDARTLRGEFLLILGHDVALEVRVVQVERDVLEQPAELADLLKAPLEKALIVGLEAQIALLPQDLIIDLQIRAPGQTALALAVGRPRIGEVQVDAVDLGRSEYLAQLRPRRRRRSADWGADAPRSARPP